MKLSVTTEIDLEVRDQKRGYVTWLDVRVSDDVSRGAAERDVAPVEGAKRPQDIRVYGTARVALVHVGEIADAVGEVWPALHGTKLEPLHDVYFSSGWYKDDYADGAGIDLLYIDRITIDEAHRGKNLDLALVRRLCDTLGSGSQLAVVAYPEAKDTPRWARLGFAVSTPGRSAGFMHLKLGHRQAQVVDATGRGDYEVVSTSESYAPAAVRSTAN